MPATSRLRSPKDPKSSPRSILALTINLEARMLDEIAMLLMSSERVSARERAVLRSYRVRLRDAQSGTREALSRLACAPKTQRK
jgi:hypothetical protein